MINQQNLVYKNAQIVTIDEQFHGYIEVDRAGNIIDVGHGETHLQGFDCQNRLLMPGFIDAHTHGGYGMSFDDFNMNTEFMNLYTNYLSQVAHEGVVAFVPTNVSLGLDRLLSIAKSVQTYLNNQKESLHFLPQLVAWFFEGPFINTIKKGAHDPNVLIPINEQFIEQIKTLIKLPIICAVAPEIGHNLTMIKKYHNDIIFALGHSNANYQETVEALNSGVKRVIHLYNAMSGFHHHDMGIVNAIYNHAYQDDVAIELISDGVHVTNEVIQTTARVLDMNNLTIVSDCLAAKGLTDGHYHLGALEIEKKDQWFYLKGTQTLAGGGCPYNELVANFKRATNCTWTDIVKLSSYNTARNLKLPSYYGRLEINAPANFIVMDTQCRIFSVVINGKAVF